MAFWKKNEDPWDIDPAKARSRRERESRRQEREESGSLLDSLQEWNEKRKAEAAEREAELAAEPPEKCPWCGKDMERGYLRTGNGGLIWTPGRMTTRAAWIGPPRELRERQLRVDNEGDFTTWKTVWYCPDCEKMTIDAAGLKSPQGFWADGEVNPFPWSEVEDSEDGEEAP